MKIKSCRSKIGLKLASELLYYKENARKVPEQEFEAIMQNTTTEEITPELIMSLKPRVEEFLNEKEDVMDCKNMFQAHVCFEVIKQLYNSKMKEYIKELSHISEKLRYYDQILAQK